MENLEELEGISFGNQKHDCIDVKRNHRMEKQVDKLYKEENNLISIFVVENKFPPMNVYYTTKPQHLKEDFINFYNNYKG